MRKIFKYEVLLWLLLSAALFAFVIPFTAINILGVIGGFAAYVFLMNDSREEIASEEMVDGRISRAMARLSRIPRHTKEFVHSKTRMQQKKVTDVRSYL